MGKLFLEGKKKLNTNELNAELNKIKTLEDYTNSIKEYESTFNTLNEFINTGLGEITRWQKIQNYLFTILIILQVVTFMIAIKRENVEKAYHHNSSVIRPILNRHPHLLAFLILPTHLHRT